LGFPRKIEGYQLKQAIKFVFNVKILLSALFLWFIKISAEPGKNAGLRPNHGKIRDFGLGNCGRTPCYFLYRNSIFTARTEDTDNATFIT